MCEHCEHNKPVSIQEDNAGDCGSRLRQLYTTEVEYCTEYAMPCYDAILNCTIINEENQE